MFDIDEFVRRVRIFLVLAVGASFLISGLGYYVTGSLEGALRFMILPALATGACGAVWAFFGAWRR